ncbi:hypothetical protein BN1232_01545 [Mycobacterium lentiflavum]|uniref:Uncharacterized protein n=1 Tax=Mycobacterium lentiflavum TaxID=141349 RepID=A0A0E4GWG0_MYCLN|nr:hypothetical protein [Mycobacterium lentiflavum]MEE3064340.1 hypothetical protein [Actinomycetota bacterium]ULP43671.1 hypothetical protein MJO58_06815 [Mycobacterium lentiflavum]CQD08592.1 hypothetical protein BN1232_01545 [Mycobacterium lentiflavum]
MTVGRSVATSPRGSLLGVASWLWVGVPFAYGLYELVVKIPALFTN